MPHPAIVPQKEQQCSMQQRRHGRLSAGSTIWGTGECATGPYPGRTCLPAEHATRRRRPAGHDLLLFMEFGAPTTLTPLPVRAIGSKILGCPRRHARPVLVISKLKTPSSARRPYRLQVSACTPARLRASGASAQVELDLAGPMQQRAPRQLMRARAYRVTVCTRGTNRPASPASLPPLPSPLYIGEASPQHSLCARTGRLGSTTQLAPDQLELASFRVPTHCTLLQRSQPAMPAFAGSAAEPPLVDSYHALLRRCGDDGVPIVQEAQTPSLPVVECELPMIDVGCLTSSGGSSEAERAACAAAIVRAAEEWGFFQVRNHGVARELLDAMRREQARLFRLPFEAKATAGLLDGSYRWGTPTATSPRQLSWSEAFHVPLAGVSGDGSCDFGDLTALRYVRLAFDILRRNKYQDDVTRPDVTRKVAGAMSRLAGTLARVMAEALLPPAGAGDGCCFFPEGCDETTCFLRLNRYPPCPVSPDAFGLVPHTDSDFLTVLSQDHVGGLQLMKGARWVAVKPIPDALIVNVGDLFQADRQAHRRRFELSLRARLYKSVEHKVMTNATTERYSVAYFLCPSYDSPIGTCEEPSPYRAFTFGEYRNKVQEDVKRTGKKIGLPNFLV
ncbi:hypothetical protein HU200_039265 [Digitaria exilis]|uniref:Fe2OG dioxygenase domain-containing protein n=1 Tax=Digitaria exilis TaxID=1010633 RepID=A0A835B8P6_9POAL|nr:hypothetical protein HU200_039265 [Digitaria exilis]